MSRRSDGRFNDIYEHISLFLRSSSNRTSHNTIALFWIKLKANLSFRKMRSLFDMAHESESRRKWAVEAFDSMRKLLVEQFVPKYLGINHITKNEVRSYNTKYTKVRLCY